MKPLSWLIVLVAYTASFACFDPQSKFYSGALFNNGETINLLPLKAMGTKGINYLAACEQLSGSGDSILTDTGTLCSVVYRGHYGVNTLVHIGYFAPVFQPKLSVPRIVVCLDTLTIPTPAEKALAVATELRWLSSQGVVTLSEGKIASLQQKLAVNGDQYWSMQDTTLPYNSWFAYDTIKGVWQTGAYSVRGVKGGCGANITYALPRDPLNPASIMNGAPHRTAQFASRMLRAPQAVFTLRGQRVSDARAFGRNGLPNGLFIVVDKTGIRPWYKNGGHGGKNLLHI
jgi:hypothetical protein